MSYVISILLFSGDNIPLNLDRNTLVQCQESKIPIAVKIIDGKLLRMTHDEMDGNELNGWGTGISPKEGKRL